MTLLVQGNQPLGQFVALPFFIGEDGASGAGTARDASSRGGAGPCAT
jgi:hypothetical protein